MAKLLLNYHGVPEDEIEELRALLEENEVVYHETGRGFFGLSVPGLWITDPEQYEQGTQLYWQYQQARYEQNKDLPTPTWAQMAAQQPGKWLLSIILIAAVLTLFFLPAWFLMRS